MERRTKNKRHEIQPHHQMAHQMACCEQDFHSIPVPHTAVAAKGFGNRRLVGLGAETMVSEAACRVVTKRRGMARADKPRKEKKKARQRSREKINEGHSIHGTKRRSKSGPSRRQFAKTNPEDQRRREDCLLRGMRHGVVARVAIGGDTGGPVCSTVNGAVRSGRSIGRGTARTATASAAAAAAATGGLCQLGKALEDRSVAGAAAEVAVHGSLNLSGAVGLYKGETGWG